MADEVRNVVVKITTEGSGAATIEKLSNDFAKAQVATAKADAAIARANATLARFNATAGQTGQGLQTFSKTVQTANDNTGRFRAGLQNVVCGWLPRCKHKVMI